MSSLLQKVDAIEPQIREIWKTIHANPELGLELYETAELIESELRKHTSVDRIHRVGKSGIWAEMKGNRNPMVSELISLMRQSTKDQTLLRAAKVTGKP